MRLKRFLLRFHPPGIGWDFEQNKEAKTKMIDLLQLDEQ